MSRSHDSGSRVRGRFAPSPSGELHLGNASTALLAWLSVRSLGGTFVMRVEDLDAARSRAELVEHNLADLRWLGLDWDEGPDVGGPHAPYIQSERFARYRDAFRQLQSEGRLYPCFCSRKEIAASAHAPQEPGDERRYPGVCRDLDPTLRRRRLEAGARHAWRVRAPAADGPDDFVVRRSDGVPAYQLAVVVDDAAMEISEVVRGDDLLGSTPRQLLLYEALGLSAPTFTHVPLLCGPDGVRLSKRHAGVTLCELRERGVESDRIVGALAFLLGLRETGAALPAAALVSGFDLGRLGPRPGGVIVDVERLFPEQRRP